MFLIPLFFSKGKSLKRKSVKRSIKRKPVKRPLKRKPVKRPAKRIKYGKIVDVKKFKFARSTHVTYESIDLQDLKNRLRLYVNKPVKHSFALEIFWEGIDLDTGDEIDGAVSSNLGTAKDIYKNFDNIIEELKRQIKNYNVLVTSITYNMKRVTYA